MTATFKSRVPHSTVAATATAKPATGETMSEPNPEQESATTLLAPSPSATDVPSEETFPADLGDAGKKAIDAMKAERDAARREARANADAAKRLAEVEESQKSEAQKTADRAAAAERERDEARTESLRYKAAATHKVDADNFDLLGTGTEEEITERAQRVGTLLSENAQMKAELEALRAGKPAPIGGRPVEALKPGATPENNQSEDDVLYSQLFGG